MSAYLQISTKSLHNTGIEGLLAWYRAQVRPLKYQIECLQRRLGSCRGLGHGMQVAMVLGPSLCTSVTHAADPALLQQLRLAAATGDLLPTIQLVEELERDPSSAPDELSRVLMQQFQERFRTPPDALEGDGKFALPEGVMRAYREYWRAVLTRSTEPEQAESTLRKQLHSLLLRQPGDANPGRDVYEWLEQVLEQQGFGSSAAATPPWQDLYIWRSEHSGEFVVSLTDTMEKVHVTFIEQPLIQGWQHFASLDLVTTSGWATASGLFCLCESYDLGSTTFEVSWLKHETRHSVDLRLYPGIEETHMEYRAKLTELAFAGADELALLRQFTASGNAAGKSAHARANYQVSRDLYREIFNAELPAGPNPWQSLGPYRVAPAARRLLERDTEVMRQASHKPAGADPAAN